MSIPFYYVIWHKTVISGKGISAMLFSCRTSGKKG